MTEQAKKLELEQKEADIAETKSTAIKNAIAALKDAPLAFHPAMPMLDQRTLSLADTLEDEIAPPAEQPPAMGGAMPPGAPQGGLPVSGAPALLALHLRRCHRT